MITYNSHNTNLKCTIYLHVQKNYHFIINTILNKSVYDYYDKKALCTVYFAIAINLLRFFILIKIVVEIDYNSNLHASLLRLISIP